MTSSVAQWRTGPADMVLPLLQPHLPVTISISYVRDLLSGQPARPAADTEALLQQAGIGAELLQHPAARVTATQYVALFRALCDWLDDECLGFLARPLKRGSYALMAQSALSAQNLQQAILRLAATFRLLQDDVELDLIEETTVAGLALRYLDPAVPRSPFLDEFLLRSLWRMLDWLAGGALAIAGFDFSFAAPADTARYGDFFNAPLAFGRPRSVFWFDVKQLQSLVRVDESALREFLNNPQSRLTVGQPGHETSAKVRRHLHQCKPAWPDLAETALALCMSVASLQRNLAKERTSFQALKDKLRRDMALTLLDTSSISMPELATRLGFSESAAFQRAFKAWTGSAPGSYRRARRAAG